MNKTLTNIQNPEMEIDLSDELAQGCYANVAIISHSSTEFILDFAAMLPGMQKPKVNNRVIVTPEHAKRLLVSLQDNIAKFEGAFGEITTPTMRQSDRTQESEMIIPHSKMGEA